MRTLLAILILGAVGCGSSGDSCTKDQVEVDYFRGDRDGDTVCLPIPASCGAVASCSVQACIHDLYGLCEAPAYIGVGCSDTFAPTIVSCNP